MAELTFEQRAAVESRGKIIVSASAGSGKTFVMIEKLTRAIENGADSDNVLAVTFTKKAAAQIKDKLRASLVKRLEGADALTKNRIKAQISKISSSDISTIHSFCSRLIRAHFYALGIDGGFDIMADEDPAAADLKDRALENLFDRYYAEGDADFLHLIKRYYSKRSDGELKQLVLKRYGAVRNVAHYRELLENTQNLYTDGGFERVAAELNKYFAAEYRVIADEIRLFKAGFPKDADPAYGRLLDEMAGSVESCADAGLFGKLPPLTLSKKPKAAEGDPVAEKYEKFRKTVYTRTRAVRGSLGSESEEREAFYGSGKTAAAFTKLILDFDGEYTRVKLDENKLDYADLEHLTLKLLQNADIKKEIISKYRYVFVDEYQDVNPVQEEILSAMEGDVFSVGDIKQAIYGFRGSKSLFFAEKYDRMKGEGGALKLTGNFRSTPEVLELVNGLFSDIMREETCGFDYAGGSRMTAAAPYPQGSGGADILVFGEDERTEREAGVYSVIEDSRPAPYNRGALAVLRLVESELAKKYYDLDSGEYRDVQPGDICILVRKNTSQTEEIIRALRDAGYAVAGVQEGKICKLPEVKQLLDILSLIDDPEQDIPLATALLSPLGGLSEDEAARIRIACKLEGKIPFRRCCEIYAAKGRDAVASKLNAFYQRLEKLRDLAEILPASELIDELLAGSGLEAAYSAGTGEKLRNVLRVAAEGQKLTLAAFLAKIKAGGDFIKAASPAPSDSINIMTMHAAKGLEFPVVILADICRRFTGREDSTIPFDEKYGFAPMYFDGATMTRRETILRRLVKRREDGEDLKNELNLFYVACTRAKCRLHILAASAPVYTPWGAKNARSYAQLFDINKFGPVAFAPAAGVNRGRDVEVAAADDGLKKAVSERFCRQYPHAGSVDLPVKSSASAIIRSMREDEPYYAENELFRESEGDTGAERGTAYHRFLELCDFGINTAEGVQKELENFIRSGEMTAEQAGLVSAEQLAKILNMPVFAGLAKAQTYREREFLCRLRACDVMDTVADDFVLFQGAIDLMAITDGGVRIIDYKYSAKTDGELVKTYSRQLALYKKTAAVALGTDEKNISTAIVNIRACRQIILDPGGGSDT